jgi:HAAS domain-containing protein
VAGVSAAVGMSEAGSDLIAGYLDRLRAGLRVPAAEAELIVAEAEDHLRETAAAGREVGMTERAAQEAAISSFGPVRAVVRAHHARRGWLAAAAEAGLAAWKLAAVLLLTSGVTGLAIDTVMRFWPPVVTVTPGSQTPCWPCLATRDAVIVNPVWPAWAVAAVGGAILLAGCGLILRVRRRRGRGTLLGGFFPMVAAGFFGAIALALTTLSAGGVGVPVPGGLASGPGFPVASSPAVADYLAVTDYPAVAVYLAVAAYLALAVGYAIGMARTLRRERRDQAAAFGRVLGES